MTQIEALNIAGQCRATASSPLAKNILVDEGNGLLTELLLDAARIIEALAQPEQEPVAIKRMKEWIEYLKYLKRTSDQHMKIPSEMSAGTCWELALELEQFINTTPPQRKPLTDEEIEKLADDFLAYQIEDYQVSGVFTFARAIEAAHGIKENT